MEVHRAEKFGLRIVVSAALFSLPRAILVTSSASSMLLSRHWVRHSWPANRCQHTVPWCFTRQHRGVLSFKTGAEAVRTPSEHHQGNGRTSDLAGSSAFPPAEPLQQDSTLTVVFRWPKGLGGNEVSVIGEMLYTSDAEQDGGYSRVDMRPAANAGSFNNWSQPLVLGRSPETGDFVRSLSLPPGTYQVGPCWPAEYTDASPASACALRGQVGLRAQPVEPSWCARLPALTHPARVLQYKFLVDTQWRTSAADPLVTDQQVGAVTAFGMLEQQVCSCGAGPGWPETQTHCRPP